MESVSINCEEGCAPTAPRVWIFGFAFLSLLLLAAVGLSYPPVPPGIGPASCLIPGPPDERRNNRFARRGGRSSRDPNICWQNCAYTIDNVAKSHGLERYDKLELTDPKPEDGHGRGYTTRCSCRPVPFVNALVRAKARLPDPHRSSVNHTGTFHIFVEPDDMGRWRVYGRSIDRKSVTDLPTAYSVRWVLAGDWDKSGGPLPQNHAPNPVEDWLELRDMRGEWDGAF